MLSTCNSGCVNTFTLLETSQCDIYQRSEIPVRLLLATCDTAFPSGTYDDLAHATAFQALVVAASVGVTFELADFTWSDPTTTTKAYRSRRSPARTITTGRTLTARDYTAVDKDPDGVTSEFWDRTFYVDTIQNKAVKARGYITDKGKIYLFLNEQNDFMDYDQNFWTGYDTEVEGQTVEYKNFALNFVGDPLKKQKLPYLDLAAADPTDSLSLGWMYKSNGF